MRRTGLLIAERCREPTKILDGNGESLYHMDLGATINGTNPITGELDSVSVLTDLLLWNADQPVEFNDDNMITMTLIFQ